MFMLHISYNCTPDICLLNGDSWLVLFCVSSYAPNWSASKEDTNAGSTPIWYLWYAKYADVPFKIKFKWLIITNNNDDYYIIF